MTSTERQQHWQRIFQQWRKSELSKMRFCKEHDITLSNFYRWQKIFSSNENKPSTFIPLLSTPTNIRLVSMTVGSLRLQVSTDNLGAVLVQLKQ